MEINSHEVLVEQILKYRISKKGLYKVLQASGYKGTEEDVIRDLLYAIGATDAYMSDSRRVSDNVEMTEVEYFEVLVKEMNINY